MPLPIFDTQDAIPEAFRPEYEEKDGKWHPKDSSADELAAEKRKRAALLEEKRQEKEKREAAERERDELKRSQEAREKGISEEELQKIRDEEAKARKPLEEEREALRKENRKLKLTDRVQALYLANGGMQDRLEDAMEALGKRTDLGDKDGIVFLDKDGGVTADDAAAFFAKHKQEKPWFYSGSGSSGSGAGGSSGDASRVPATELQKITDRHATTVSRAF